MLNDHLVCPLEDTCPHGLLSTFVQHPPIAPCTAARSGWKWVSWALPVAHSPFLTSVLHFLLFTGWILMAQLLMISQEQSLCFVPIQQGNPGIQPRVHAIFSAQPLNLYTGVAFRIRQESYIVTGKEYLLIVPFSASAISPNNLTQLNAPNSAGMHFNYCCFLYWWAVAGVFDLWWKIGKP